MSATRLVVVLGYSAGRGGGLHEICAARVRLAERQVEPGDVVLLSGWARGASAASEAELMAESWRPPCWRIVLDRSARSTRGNVAGAASLARELEAGRVLLVTSPWHARRASALLRAALVGSRSTVRVATTEDRPSAASRLRELASWALVPFSALALRRGPAATPSA